MNFYIVLCLSFMAFVEGDWTQNDFTGPRNLALYQRARHSSTGWNGLARYAVDGDKNPSFEAFSCSHTSDIYPPNWWLVELRRNSEIYQIKIQNRDSFGDRLKNLSIYVDDTLCAHFPGPGENSQEYTIDCTQPLVGKQVKIAKDPADSSALCLCEVEVMGWEIVDDCSHLVLINGVYSDDGAYPIYPCGVEGGRMNAYCIFADDGLWTVFQRRFDGSVDFYRNWTEYKNGFGDALGEYWLAEGTQGSPKTLCCYAPVNIGNEALHCLTSQRNYELRVSLTYTDGDSTYADYTTFEIGNETDGYRLSIAGYNGTAEDALKNMNGWKFTTKDRNNAFLPYNCAVDFTGAWWYWNFCYDANLNGLYNPDAQSITDTMTWSYTYPNATALMIWS